MTRVPWAWDAVVVLTFAVSFVFSYGPDALRMTLPGALAISAASAASVFLSGRHPGPALALVTALAVGLPLAESTFGAIDLVVVLVVFRVTMVSDLPPWVPAAA